MPYYGRVRAFGVFVCGVVSVSEVPCRVALCTVCRGVVMESSVPPHIERLLDGSLVRFYGMGKVF